MCIAPTALATLTSPLFNKGVGSKSHSNPKKRSVRSCTFGWCFAVAEKNLVFCCGGEELHAQWVGVAVALPAVTAYNGMMIPARTTCTWLCVARLTEWGVTDPQRNHNNFSQGGVCLLPACWRPPCECPCALHQPPWLRSPPPFSQGGWFNSSKSQEEKYVRTLSCGPG